MSKKANVQFKPLPDRIAKARREKRTQQALELARAQYKQEPTDAHRELLRQVTLETGVPCSFGVITCDTREQAEARAGGGKRDQGRAAAAAAVHMHLLAADERLA